MNYEKLSDIILKKKIEATIKKIADRDYKNFNEDSTREDLIYILEFNESILKEIIAEQKVLKEEQERIQREEEEKEREEARRQKEELERQIRENCIEEKKNLDLLKFSFFNLITEENKPEDYDYPLFDNIREQFSYFLNRFNFKLYRGLYKYAYEQSENEDYKVKNLNKTFVRNVEEEPHYYFTCFRVFRNAPEPIYESFWIVNNKNFHNDSFYFDEINDKELFVNSFMKCQPELCLDEVYAR